MLRRGHLVIQDGGEEAIDRLGIADAIETIVNDADQHAVGLVPPVALGWVDMAEIGTVRQSLSASQARVLLDPPEKISPAIARLVPQRETKELTVCQAQHAGLQTCQYRLGQGDLTRPISRHLAGEQHVRAILHQRDEADLRISA